MVIFFCVFLDSNFNCKIEKGKRRKYYEVKEMYLKYSKIVLVWSVALFATLLGFNNLTDYGSNYGFVSHVLKMDTTFPDNNLMWQSKSWN